MAREPASSGAPTPTRRFEAVTREDVAIIPAFSRSRGHRAAQGHRVHDHRHTCPWVSSPPADQAQYRGRLHHGGARHSGSRRDATPLQPHPPRRRPLSGAQDLEEAGILCDFLEGGSRAPGSWTPRTRTSPGFDPERDSPRALINQTHAGQREREIGRMIEASLRVRVGGQDCRVLPGFRHHLQRHPGEPGRDVACGGGETSLHEWWWAVTTRPTRKIWLASPCSGGYPPITSRTPPARNRSDPASAGHGHRFLGDPEWLRPRVRSARGSPRALPLRTRAWPKSWSGWPISPVWI